MKHFLLRGSLRLRLLAGTLFWIIASILIAGWGLGELFRNHVSEQFHAGLQNHLDQLTAQIVLDEQNQPGLRLPLSEPRFNKPLSGLYWQVDKSTATGVSAALRSRSLWDETLDAPADITVDGELHRHRVNGPDGRPLRLVERSVSIAGAPLRLMVAANESLMSEPIAAFQGRLWLALAILGGGLTIAALSQVLIGLAPLKSLHASLGRVRRGEMQQMQGEFPVEIMPLVNEFNSVLEQNAAVVERARTQAGNLAHALKTPLSVLANAADASRSNAGGGEEGLAQVVTTQVGAVKKHVDYHLARAQAAAAVRLPGIRTHIKPVIAGLVRVMQRVHAERRINFIIHPDAADSSFRGEEQDLQEMLGNLIDNAAKWAQSRVEITVQADKAELKINIDDDGCGIAPSERERVLQRGVRADQQVPGSGLGLAIAADLAQMYGGRLQLAASPLGGLQASLQLPAVEAAEMTG